MIAVARPQATESPDVRYLPHRGGRSALAPPNHAARTRSRCRQWMALPLGCCSSMDCWEAGTGGPEPDPIPSPGGWKLSDGAVVPFHLARSSPDGRFHVCRKGGQLTG